MFNSLKIFKSVIVEFFRHVIDSLGIQYRCYQVHEEGGGKIGIPHFYHYFYNAYTRFICTGNLDQ